MPQRKAPQRSLGGPRRRRRARDRHTHAQVAQAGTQQGESPEEHESFICTLSDSDELVLEARLEENAVSGLSTVRGTTQKILMILCLILTAAFAGAYCGTSWPVWKLWAKEMPEVQPVGELQPESICRTSVAPQGELAWHIQHPRTVVSLLVSERSCVKKELQDMRKAESAIPGASAWVLKSEGVTISLERSPRSYTWPCSMFQFFHGWNCLDTFVQWNISPGYCWPFQACQSQVDIQLPVRVRPVAIAVQHPLKESSALGDISSAPQVFTVSGVDVEGEEETLLGMFRFNIQGEPTQTFPLQNELRRAFQLLRLVVQSNWGQSGYTCIYRVQVHGT